MTLCIFLAMCASQLSAGTPWREVDVMPFGAADVFAALAAITAGMIALQVMAQTLHAQPSKTLTEFNRRQTMGMLALFGPAVSCMLALFVWIDHRSHVSAMLPYLVVVAVLAGMNCFIASDAVDRIIRIDQKNVDLRIAVARKEVSHYRRTRLPWMASWKKVRVASAGLVQTLLLSALILILDALLTEVPHVSSWLGHYFVILAAQVILFVSFAAFAWARTRTDKTEQWLMGFLFLLIVTMTVLVALALEPTDGILHALTVVGIPSLIFIASMKTTTNKTTWWLSSWVPGTWVRIPAAQAVSASLGRATQELTTAKRQREQVAAGGGSR